MKIKRIHWTDSLATELKEREGISRLQGNKHADTFICAPRPGEKELEQNLAWCNKSAVIFFDWMLQGFNLNRNDDFLIMPCTFDGDKPKKGNTDVGHHIIDKVALSPIKRVIVIGSDAFKTYFGYGRKPSMQSLAGHTLYLEQVKYRPVFVFPDLHWLNFDEEGYERCTSKAEAREFYKLQFICQKTRESLTKLEPAFKKFLKAEQPNA